VGGGTRKATTQRRRLLHPFRTRTRPLADQEGGTRAEPASSAVGGTARRKAVLAIHLARAGKGVALAAKKAQAAAKGKAPAMQIKKAIDRRGDRRTRNAAARQGHPVYPGPKRVSSKAVNIIRKNKQTRRQLPGRTGAHRKRPSHPGSADPREPTLALIDRNQEARPRGLRTKKRKKSGSSPERKGNLMTASTTSSCAQRGEGQAERGGVTSRRVRNRLKERYHTRNRAGPARSVRAYAT